MPYDMCHACQEDAGEAWGQTSLQDDQSQEGLQTSPAFRVGTCMHLCELSRRWITPSISDNGVAIWCKSSGHGLLQDFLCDWAHWGGRVQSSLDRLF